MGDNSWVTNYFAPALGTFIANVMWVTPIKIMADARAAGDLGNINPIPFNVVVINCMGYTMYSILKQDYFLFFANCFGIIIGFTCCMTAMMLLTKQSPSKFEVGLRNTVESLLVGALGFWLVILLFVGLVLHGGGVSQSLVGTIAVIVSIAYYMAPMSTMARVIRKKDASSLYLPLILVNLVNAILWFVYGLAGINDIYVWLPNALGIALALVQIMLVVVYGGCGKKERDDAEPPVGVTRFSSYWVPKQPLSRLESIARSLSSFFRPASSIRSQPDHALDKGQTRESDTHAEKDDSGASLTETRSPFGDAEVKEDDGSTAEFGIDGTDTAVGNSRPAVSANKV